MGPKFLVRRLTMLTLIPTLLIATGCATRKFTRNELKAQEANLSVRLDAEDKSIGKIQDDVKELSEKIDASEKRTTDNTNSQITSVKGDIAKVDSKATDAGNAARNAQAGVDRANSAVSSLEGLFRDRNNYDIVSEKQILFPFNSAKVGEDFEGPLTEVAEQLKQSPDTFVVLEGHTDSLGNAAYNIQLGEKRNDAVSRFLIVTEGVPMFKVYRASFGKEQPIAQNDSKEGREKNRSVVLRIYRVKSLAGR